MPNPMGWPDWEYQLFIGYLPPQKNQNWMPTFAAQQFVQEPVADGKVNIQPLAITDFPTQDTANVLLQKYGNGQAQIMTIPCPFVGGPDESTTGTLPPYYALVWTSGKIIPCSMLAGIWFDNQGQPDAANTLCQQLVDRMLAVGN